MTFYALMRFIQQQHFHLRYKMKTSISKKKNKKNKASTKIITETKKHVLICINAYIFGRELQSGNRKKYQQYFYTDF